MLHCDKYKEKKKKKREQRGQEEFKGRGCLEF